jgi:hypothetical protein
MRLASPTEKEVRRVRAATYGAASAANPKFALQFAASRIANFGFKAALEL